MNGMSARCALAICGLACGWAQAQSIGISFQNGVGGYNGTYDTWLNEDSGNQNNGGSGSLNVDDDVTDRNGSLPDWFGGGPDRASQALVGFNDIFQGAVTEGDVVTRIPLGATINSATLRLRVTGSSIDDFRLERMTRSWNENTTWNSFGSGIQFGSETTGSGGVDFDGPGEGDLNLNVRTIVQDWSNGSANFGFGIQDRGDNVFLFEDGVDFASSENGNVGNRPELIVNASYTVANAAAVLSSFTASSNTINEGDSVTFNIAGFDPSQSGANDGSVDDVTFFIDGQNRGTSNGSGSALSTITYTDDGVFVVGGQVIDDDGAASGVSNQTITVLNVAPTIVAYTGETEADIFTPTPLFSFGVSATDPGDDLLTFSWDLDGDGLFDDATGDSGSVNLNDLSYAWPDDLGEIFQIEVRVDDGDGGVTFGTFDITIVPTPGSVGLAVFGGLLAARRRRA